MMTSAQWHAVLASVVVAHAAALHISVETWRFHSHSYAVVGQNVLLQLLHVAGSRSGGAAGGSGVDAATPPLLRSVLTDSGIDSAEAVTVSVFDAPLYQPHWVRQRGLFSNDSEEALWHVEATEASQCPDVVFRSYFPMNLSPWPSSADDNTRRWCRPRVFVFGTTEYAVTIPAMLQGSQFGWSNMEPNVRILPPSMWALSGFLRGGVPEDKLLLLPHGFDPDTFRCVDRGCVRRPRPTRRGVRCTRCTLRDAVHPAC